jgi:hypothetical protein
LALVALSALGCPPRSAPESRRPAERVVAPPEFAAALATYAALRARAQRELPPAQSSDDPTKVVARQRALAAGIRALRPDAKRGDVFTPAASAEFRRVIAADLRSRDRRDAAATERQAPPVALRVNDTYPDHVSLAPVPPMLLLMFPTLAPGLEYRVVNRNLLLLDADANLIVDFIPDVLPAAE